MKMLLGHFDGQTAFSMLNSNVTSKKLNDLQCNALSQKWQQRAEG